MYWQAGYCNEDRTIPEEMLSGSSELEWAVAAARSARFEYGESGSSKTANHTSNWNYRVTSWARKVYGEYWADSPGYEVAEEAFSNWLRRKEEE
jgi:hypothetical protein